MNPTAFAIKTETFEGPMELLIELVEKRKLLINDISLAEVTDEYMQMVSAMQEMSLPNTAQFVSLAATLLLIKSKSLLPVLDLTTEEEASIEDLEDRLKKYQLYRDIALGLQIKFGQQVMYEPEYAPPREPIFVTDKLCAVSELRTAMERVLTSLPKFETKPTAKVRPTISLEDMMVKLRNRIETQMKTRFSELQAHEKDRKNIIVGFLAILELFKQGDLIITQTGFYEDIHLELERTNTPKYY
ncbi:segregation/condensation protein A [Candidatus Nomurabacteria bacterium]|nr:segregation/condensation protein A [Candidatus Kaiserbacteria bacterium]MCA9360786.1 segregation/condensation protein A [Candidatus Kaiserbacteria bacterium]MCB9810449.1 segregation/condensation protein A [Candidatus Nomurabacteria bacterium]MCB9818222.1 segregation/condensation protein A [Candidatus Nomurabacteria bacterium]